MKYILIFLFMVKSYAYAWETDNFTRSPIPIVDTGTEVSHYIFNKIQKALKKTSKVKDVLPVKIKLQAKYLKDHILTKPKFKSSKSIEVREFKSLKRKMERNLKKLTKRYQALFTEKGIAQIITDAVGRPIAKQEKLDAIFGKTTDLTPYKTGFKNDRPTYFYPGKLESVYSFAGFHRVLHAQYFILSSTINLYGIELGMDKLGHFFNEGHKYYLLYKDAIDSGLSEEKSIEVARKWGMTSEASYFGMLVSGIYSNADLASNYAGLYFYKNLFKPITIDGVSYPAILKKARDGSYSYQSHPENEPRIFFKRFISHHMNEVYNPSSFELLQKIVVEKAVESRCDSWIHYTDASSFYKISSKLKRWNGEDYGHVEDNLVSLEEICF